MQNPQNTLLIGHNVFRLGLGTNRITDSESAKTILREAVKKGINFIDTAAAYTNGQSEEMIGTTLYPYNNIVIATKGGMHAPQFAVDARPESLAKQLTLTGLSLPLIKVC